MEFHTDYLTERFALQTVWEDLPESVRRRAVSCSIDLMGALILGSRSRQFQTGCNLALSMGMTGSVPAIGAEKTFNLAGAAIAMGHSSNSFDIDDGFNLIKGHPGTSFVAGTLAAALQQDASYREYLTTLVICYELTIRWGLAMQDHYGFLHSTGAYGAFGTALGVGRLLGFDEKQLNTALSIADYHAPMTPVMRAVEYPSMNKDGVPFGALTGTMAALEASFGETGRTHLLELEEYRPYLDSLGERYYIQELYFKPWTCCRWAHQPIKACLDLKEQEGFTPEEIEQVCVHTFEAAARLYKGVPTSTDEAQYNIAWPVAAALVHGEVGYLQICDDALGDEKVKAMMSRLRFEVDPQMQSQFPEKRLAWVEIRLKDGRTLRSQVYAAPGEHTDPALNEQWILDKFRRVTAPLLSGDAQEELLELLQDVQGGQVREIVAAVNAHLAR